MLVIQTDPNSRLLEIDSDLFDDVKEFIKQLSLKKERSFSYIDDFGDKIIVANGKEWVVPTKDDLNALYDEDELIDESEAKRLLGV
jgi:hypothetical protein